MKKRLPQSDYLTAVALFTVANQHYAEAQKCQKVLSKLLGYDDQWAGCLGDAMLDANADAVAALADEGFTAARKAKRNWSKDAEAHAIT